MKDKPTRSPAFDAGLKMLAYGDKTANELWRRLTEKGYSAIEADEVVAKMTEYRYIDDQAFAHRYVEKNKKKKSKRQMKWELLKRGVPDDVADNALQDIEGSDDWD